MKHIYHLHLNGSNLEHDKVFGDCELNHRGASDIDGGWHHCAPTVETLAQFVHAICHKTDCGSITINRLIISRFTQNKHEKQYPEMFGWDWHWDANEEELAYVNSGFTHTKKDQKKLVRFIVKNCDGTWKHHDCCLKETKGKKVLDFK